MSAEATARAAIDAINDRTLRARAAELLEPSVVCHDLVHLFPDSQGPGGGAGFVEMLVAAIPALRLDIRDMISAGDRAVVWLEMTGMHTGQLLLGEPATGRTLSANAVFIYRVTAGRIAEAWQMVDGLAFFRLAGLLD
jgi:predicted ester cyclase